MRRRKGLQRHRHGLQCQPHLHLHRPGYLQDYEERFCGGCNLRIPSPELVLRQQQVHDTHQLPIPFRWLLHSPYQQVKPETPCHARTQVPRMHPLEQISGSNILLVDPYFAGRSAGKPVLLNCFAELNKKTHWRGTKQEQEEKLVKEFDEHEIMDAQETTVDEEEMYAEEEGQLSWFNEGVRVGIGLGVGLSIWSCSKSGASQKTSRATMDSTSPSTFLSLLREPSSKT